MLYPVRVPLAFTYPSALMNLPVAGFIVSALQVVQRGLGWILLCAQERFSPSRDLLFRAVPAEKANVTALYQVPASIAVVIRTIIFIR